MRGTGPVVSGQERDSGRSPGFTPLLPVRSYFRTGASTTSWRTSWSLMVRAEILDLGVKGAEVLDSWKREAPRGLGSGSLPS